MKKLFTLLMLICSVVYSAEQPKGRVTLSIDKGWRKVNYSNDVSVVYGHGGYFVRDKHSLPEVIRFGFGYSGQAESSIVLRLKFVSRSAIVFRMVLNDGYVGYITNRYDLTNVVERHTIGIGTNWFNWNSNIFSIFPLNPNDGSVADSKWVTILTAEIVEEN